MTQFALELADLAVLLFVISSMIGMGLMSPLISRCCRALPSALLIVLVTAACGSVGKPAPTSTMPTALATAGMTATPVVEATLVPTIEAEVESLTVDEAATLRSLEQVDDYPLYVMHYQGDYESPATSVETGSVGQVPAWGCSLFAALGDPENRLYGRNFDWQYSPALLLFTKPSDGYSSVSIVDIAYLGFSGIKAHSAAELPLAERQDLLYAPHLPFDGMNEEGLVVGMAAVDSYNMQPDPGKETVGALDVIREMLDHAATVDEAVAILQSYNVDFESGPPLHYLVADRQGRAVLVEFYEDEIVLMPNENPWHQATNSLRASAGESAEGEWPRYDHIHEALSDAEGKLERQKAMDLLVAVAQSTTQWSVVYNTSSGGIDVAMGQNYEDIYTFQLEP